MKKYCERTSINILLFININEYVFAITVNIKYENIHYKVIFKNYK